MWIAEVKSLHHVTAPENVYSSTTTKSADDQTRLRVFSDTDFSQSTTTTSTVLPHQPSVTTGCDDRISNGCDDTETIIIDNSHTAASDNLSITATGTHYMTDGDEDETFPAQKRARPSVHLATATQDDSKRCLDLAAAYDVIGNSNRSNPTESSFDQAEQIDIPERPQKGLEACVHSHRDIVNGLYNGEPARVRWCRGCRKFKDASSWDDQSEYCSVCEPLSFNQKRKRKDKSTDASFDRDLLQFFYKDTDTEIFFWSSCVGYHFLEDMGTPRSCKYRQSTNNARIRRTKQNIADSVDDLQWDQTHTMDYSTLTKNMPLYN